ncbi:MAG TPA: hypothetical protein VGV93_00565 [Acidimicrobiales bacterium]|nr:hypothetical protein [Acidimicrobiales bacterium]
MADDFCGVGKSTAAAPGAGDVVVAGHRPSVDAEQASRSAPPLRPEPRKALRRRVCGSKPRLGVTAAHRLAEQRRRLGDDVSAYRCVFCGRWHVGPVPSMDTIEALARVIRGLAP